MSSINVDPAKVKYVYTKSLEQAEADYKSNIAKAITKEADRLYDAKGFLYWRVLFDSHPQYDECLKRAEVIVSDQRWESNYFDLHFRIDVQRSHCSQMIAMASCCDHQYLTLSGDDVKSYSNRAKIYLHDGEIPLV